MNDLQNYDWVGLLESVAIALVILLVTWLIARLVKMAFTRLVGRVGFLQRQSSDGQSLGAALGTIASLLVWLLGLIAILQVFNLDQVMQPIQSMLDTFFSYLPNIIGAAFLFFVGFILAKIARDLIRTALDTAGFDRGVSRLTGGELGDSSAGRSAGQGVPEAQGGATEASAVTAQDSSSGTSLSTVLANLVFAVILIVVSIAALQILGIQAIADPAESMLQMILDAIPNIIAAALLLAIGWYVAKFASQLLESTLAGLGVDRSVADMGVAPGGQRASTILARIAQIGILLFFAVMAARALGFPEITNFLEEVLALGSRVVFGAAFIAAGVFIAGLLRRFVSGTAGQVVYWVTIALFTAMGLNFMGIADSIVNMAFGAIVIGAALAAALAFGLGGRDAAARQLNKAERELESPDTPNRPGAAGTR